MSKTHVGRRHKVWVLLQERDKPVAEFDPDPAKWQTRHSVPATITPVRGDEPTEGERATGRISHLVRARWMPGVTSAWRIVVEDATLGNDAEPDTDQRRKLNIVSVIEIEPHRYLEFQCLEITT